MLLATTTVEDFDRFVEIYATKWLSFRFDVRDVVLVQEAVGETRLTNNIQATLGLGLWLPFWFI